MADNAPRKSRVRSVTVAALLGVFVAAVVLAVAGRLLPGPLSRLMKKPDGDRH
jgi:Kef-type K+ transport system membrane component KefB